MKHNIISKKEALSLYNNSDFINKTLIDGFTEGELLSGMVKGFNVLFSEDDGSPMGLFQATQTEQEEVVSIHGYCFKPYRTSYSALYELFAEEYLKPNGFTYVVIFCDQQVRNFAIKRNGFSELNKITFKNKHYYKVGRTL